MKMLSVIGMLFCILSLSTLLVGIGQKEPSNIYEKCYIITIDGVQEEECKMVKEYDGFFSNNISPYLAIVGLVCVMASSFGGNIKK